MTKITPDEIKILAKYIYDISGISLDESKTYLFETRLGPLVEKHGFSSYTELCQKAKTDLRKTIETEIINAEQHGRITNDETLRFFRRLGGSETVQRAYTFGGYVVISLSSISPDRTIKKVRQFTFEK